MDHNLQVPEMEDILLEERNSKIRGDNTICAGEWRDDQGDCAGMQALGIEAMPGFETVTRTTLLL
jgi:hypothetical protein